MIRRVFAAVAGIVVSAACTTERGPEGPTHVFVAPVANGQAPSPAEAKTKPSPNDALGPSLPPLGEDDADILFVSPVEGTGRPLPATAVEGFDDFAAARVLAATAREADARCVDRHEREGRGIATLVFERSGDVVASRIDGPWGRASVRHCLRTLFDAVKVPPFEGPPIRVAKSFTLH